VKVRFLKQAITDLRATVEHIAQHNPDAALALADRVLRIVEQLAAREFEGAEQRLRSGRLVRSWPVPPLRVYYQRRGGELVVLRIYHHARRPLTR
jgi:plasmid stabilization system protein ParE